jgi:hypothetical protein
VLLRRCCCRTRHRERGAGRGGLVELVSGHARLSSRQAGWSSVVRSGCSRTKSSGYERRRLADQRGPFVYANRLGPGWLDAPRIRIWRAVIMAGSGGTPSSLSSMKRRPAVLERGGGRPHAAPIRRPPVVGVVRDTSLPTIGEAITPQVPPVPAGAADSRNTPCTVIRADGRASTRDTNRSRQALCRRSGRCGTRSQRRSCRRGSRDRDRRIRPCRRCFTLGVYGLILHRRPASREVALRRAVERDRHIRGTVGAAAW